MEADFFQHRILLIPLITLILFFVIKKISENGYIK